MLMGCENDKKYTKRLTVMVIMVMVMVVVIVECINQ